MLINESMSKLILFPCNGNALEAMDCLGVYWQVIGIVDDNQEKRAVSSTKIFNRDFFSSEPQAKVLAVPGSPESFLKRRQIIEGLQLDESRFATIIHPSAQVSKFSTIGKNTLLMAGVVVAPNVRIGNNVVVLPNTVVHHDCVVEDYTLIGSNVTLAGSVHVGVNCYIGSGTSVMNNIRIGDKALIGLGSNVIRDVNPGTKNAGNPARQL
jgi:sugar O-acyltransferase (sialic acid O-acetyltransferase NeuD family)